MTCRAAAKALPRKPATDPLEPEQTKPPDEIIRGLFRISRHQLLEFLFRFRFVRFIFHREIVVEYPVEKCAVISQNPPDFPGQIVELVAITLHPLPLPLFLRCLHHAEMWQHPPVPSD